jgi:hypothetical protein
MVSEGVSLDIIKGVAIFTSNLTGHVITSRDLKNITSANDDEFVLLIRGLSIRKWFEVNHESELRNFVNNNRF